jgi:hypothetical protein
MMDLSRHRSVDTLRGYIRDAEIFKETCGRGAALAMNGAGLGTPTIPFDSLFTRFFHCRSEASITQREFCRPDMPPR